MKRVLGITFVIVIFWAVSLAPAQAMNLADVLTLTPDSCPAPMGRKDMPLEVGQKYVEGTKRANHQDISAACVLKNDNTEYVLTNDIVAQGTGIKILASHITLNLNGHTITYNNKELGHGVSLEKWWLEDVEIINGNIVQGNARGSGEVHGIGCNPIYALSSRRLTIAGLSIRWSGGDINGMYIRGSEDVHIYNNTIDDEGSIITNRHQGIKSISINGTRIKINGNKILRARQQGIVVSGDAVIEGNEVHIDSQATNSFAIDLKSGIIQKNKVYGIGMHPIGIWPGPGVQVISNYVEMQNTLESTEYESAGSAALRMTWGKNDGVEAWANTFFVKAKKNGIHQGLDSWGRAVFVGLPDPNQHAFFHHNLLVATDGGDGSKAAAVGMVCMNNSSGFVFEHNIIASDWSPLLLGDDYGGCDGFPVFRQNRIIKLGNSENFKTIRSLYRDYHSTALLVSNSFEDGAKDTDISFELPSPARKEIRYAQLIQVQVRNAAGKPLSGAEVDIFGSDGQRLFQGQCDPSGAVSAEVITRRLTNQSSPLAIFNLSDFHDPARKVVVRFEGKELARDLEPDKDAHLEVVW